MTVLRYYTEESLGPNRSLTPEGFLVCRDVPIARTGTLLYGPGEVPIDPGPDKVITIARDPDEVFSPQSVASFEGKPVTNDHPPLGIKVDPTNWRQLAIGDVQNVRRGDGAILDDQFLYADMVIKDAAAIRDILDGKKEVSAGYDAEYEQLSPGRGRQLDIIGNHVALVDKGRCGPRCSIGDEDTMAKRSSVIDRIKAAYYSRDEGALVTELAKVDEMMGDVVSDDAPSGMHFHFGGMGGGSSSPTAPAKPMMGAGDDADPAAAAVAGPDTPGAGAGDQPPPWAAALIQRIETIEKAVIMLAQDEGDDAPAATDPDDNGSGEEGGDAPGTVAEDSIMEEQPTWREGHGGISATVKGNVGDRRRARVGDSAGLATAFQDMVSRAAILAPGYKVPTFDSARSARLTVDDMCNFRRSVLAQSWKTQDGKETIGRIYTPTRRGPDFSRDSMSCDAVTALFNGASALAAGSNTQDAKRVMAAAMDHGREVSTGGAKVPTIADLNARARDVWDKRLGAQVTH